MEQNRDKEKQFREACVRGDETAARDLVRHGVNINSTNEDGFCGLHLAVCAGHFNHVMYLLSLEEINVNSRNNYDHTPLHCGAFHDRREIVEELLKRGDIRLDIRDKQHFDDAKDLATKMENFKQVSIKAGLQAIFSARNFCMCSFFLNT